MEWHTNLGLYAKKHRFYSPATLFRVFRGQKLAGA